MPVEEAKRASSYQASHRLRARRRRSVETYSHASIRSYPASYPSGLRKPRQMRRLSSLYSRAPEALQLLKVMKFVENLDRAFTPLTRRSFVRRKNRQLPDRNSDRVRGFVISVHPMKTKMSCRRKTGLFCVCALPHPHGHFDIIFESVYYVQGKHSG